MNEFELIGLLSASLPTNDRVRVGAGDDCAVLELGLSDRFVLFKTDAVVEGIHFAADAPAEKIGHKALARCLSDIAAMAGMPLAALITLALPPQFSLPRIQGIYCGLNALAAKYAVAIVGGETTTNPERMLISVAMLGTVDKHKCVLRSGAKPGDALFVTGQLGGSLAGKHLEFEPRLTEARWLTEHFDVHAMIDLSDGLAGDLPHILKASGGLGAEILAEAIPVSRVARIQAKNLQSSKTALQAALTDGEDFELLFAIASRDAVSLLDAWKEQFPELPLTCIGKITAEPGLRIRSKKGLQPLTAHGYTHFA